MMKNQGIRRTHRMLPAAAALLILMAVLAGCGGGKKEETSAAQAPEVETAAETGAAAAVADEASAEVKEEQPAEIAEDSSASESKETAKTEPAKAPRKSPADWKPEMPADGSPITFIDQPFYEGVIENEEDAVAAVMSVIEYLGGTKDTELELRSIRPNEDGDLYYTFQQLEGETVVYASAIKLVVDKDGQAVALISSLTPDIDTDKIRHTGISEEEAEEIVRKVGKDSGLEVVKDATMRTILPYEDTYEFYTCWVVFTNNPGTEYDAAYLAHYVDIDGQYLYSLPVSEPNNADSLSGEGATLAFHGMEPTSWTGMVKTYDGKQKEITIPTMTDPETGIEYLGDADRKILCADYARYAFDDTITFRIREDCPDNELMIYDTFVRIWDTYADIGWAGPDGDGTPALLLMDWVDEDGDPVMNACYAGRQHGYQTFQFNREDPDGENTDIMAHEFTHCLTSTLMTENLYFNDYGAINEGFSDICGNLIEEMLGDTDDTEWLIGEHGETLRSMSHPNEYEQPAFVWDYYYVPASVWATSSNDNGGVHINSSLLNMVAYRLHEAGMPAGDQLYYWVNVSLAMTPRTDFAQMTKLLPWVMNETGYTQYIDDLNKAIEEVGMGKNELPEEVSGGRAMISLHLPYAELMDSFDISATFVNLENENTYTSWPAVGTDRISVTVPAGDYVTLIVFTDETGSEESVAAFQMNDGWAFEDIEALSHLGDYIDDMYWCHVDEGEFAELETDTLKKIMEE